MAISFDLLGKLALGFVLGSAGVLAAHPALLAAILPA